jgi:hypothetical protein
MAGSNSVIADKWLSSRKRIDTSTRKAFHAQVVLIVRSIWKERSMVTVLVLKIREEASTWIIAGLLRLWELFHILLF